MRKPSAPPGRPAAFTLIEILLAMAIMAVVCGTIYQFTGTTVRVASVAMRVGAREQALGGLRHLLAAQFAVLPASEPQALVGAAGDGKNGRQDTLQMLCPAGSAVLTPDARGLYQVAFELREMPAGSGHHTLVMSRDPWEDDAQNAAGSAGAFQLPAVSAGGFRTSAASGGLGPRPSDWVRLLDGVSSLELDYFDPRLNTWVDKWNDATMTPSLVRVRLAMEGGGAPYEFVEKVPGGGMPRGLLAVNMANMPVPSLPAGLVLPNGVNNGGVVNGVNGGRSVGVNAPTAPPPGLPPTLPPGVRPPTGLPTTSGAPTVGGTPAIFDPTKPFIAPNTGTDLPPGFH